MTLAALADAGFQPDLVVTRADSVAGRRGRLAPPPVKTWALARGIPVWQPENINSPDSVKTLAALSPKVYVVVAYGRILSKDVLAIPPLGSINVHGSLLPDLRGAAPIEWALMLGYQETGVTTMYMDQGMDTGDIILQERVLIDPEENRGHLEAKLAAAAQRLLPVTLALVFNGEAPRTPQPLGSFRRAPALTSDAERLDWRRPADALANKIRALAPAPGAFCCFRGKRLKIYRAAPVAGSLSIGSLQVGNKRLLAGTGAGVLELLELQPEGRKKVTAPEFINGYRIQEGELLK